MRFESWHWDEYNCCCVEHRVPELPCRACMVDPVLGKDVVAVITDGDLSCLEEGQSIQDLLPIGFKGDFRLG